MTGKLIARLIALTAPILFCSRIVFALPDIVFITQPPNPTDFATANATFGNHLATLTSIPRGGDLYIRYADGTLKNITASAGFGAAGFQGAQAIAVRDPVVHWDGKKILFSMVIGAPTEQYQVNTYAWQLYEVTGIAKNEAPIITKVANQPTTYNNVMGTYSSTDRIIFVSDRPRDNLSHTHPQRDEYESTPTNTGLWSLNPQTGELQHLDHAPSGDFSPSVDSFGRIIFTRWDHLQRDQQNRCSQPSYSALNYVSESNGASTIDSDAEVYPEPRGACEDDPNDNLDLHSFNHFMPWMMNQDGSEMETINHIGRHELADYIGRSFNNDPDIEEYYGQYPRVNQHAVTNLFHLIEDPVMRGRYYAVSAPEFGTHASGQIVRFDAPPSAKGDEISIISITHPDTGTIDDTPSGQHIGFSRDPVPLSDGAIIAAHAPATVEDSNLGSSSAPQSRYAFRLKTFTSNGQYFIPQTTLTSGITKTVSFWSPDELVTYTNVTMWELQPKEIKVTTRPLSPVPPLVPAPEYQIFTDEGVDPAVFKSFLRDNNLALIVSRNVTTRDQQDRQQPTNLKVAHSSTSTLRTDGRLYEVSHLQIFQGDLIRGYGASSGAGSGRRVLAQPLHSVDINPSDETAPAGGVRLGDDGSMAAFVPARRAITYQLTDPTQKGVVRERFWLTFQPGEIRVCGSCHGINSLDQAGNPPPQNSPEALRALLRHWKQLPTATPTPVPQSNIPAIKLKVKLQTSRQRRTGPIRPARVRLTIDGQNEYARNAAFSIEVVAGSISCGEVFNAKTGTSGNSVVTSKPLRLSKRSTTLRFRVVYANQLLRSAKLQIPPSSRKSLKKARLCAAIKNAF